MFKTITLFLLPLMLLSETAMKCEAGKCATDKTSMTKDIPEKPETSSSKTSAMKEASKDNKPMRSQRPTIEQLFNVKTVQVKDMTASQKQVNFGYIVAQDSRMVDVLTWYSGFVNVLYTDTLYKKCKKVIF